MLDYIKAIDFILIWEAWPYTVTLYDSCNNIMIYICAVAEETLPLCSGKKNPSKVNPSFFFWINSKIRSRNRLPAMNYYCMVQAESKLSRILPQKAETCSQVRKPQGIEAAPLIST